MSLNLYDRVRLGFSLPSTVKANKIWIWEMQVNFPFFDAYIAIILSKKRRNYEKENSGDLGSSELLVTMDTPPWYYRWIYRSPGHNQMKRTILGFCGVKVNRISEFSPIKGSSKEKRDKWLKMAEVLGNKA